MKQETGVVSKKKRGTDGQKKGRQEPAPVWADYIPDVEKGPYETRKSTPDADGPREGWS